MLMHGLWLRGIPNVYKGKEKIVQTRGNTVLITGGTSGIGLALAKQFLAVKNTVIITGRSAAKLAAVRDHLPTVITELADMTDRRALEQLAGTYGDVNILINNAAIQHNYDLADPNIPVEQIDQELDTNLVGPLVLTKLFLPQLLRKSAAAIVNISSGLAVVPKQSAPVYCGSKAALHIFTQALRWQLEGSSVRVFEVIPPLVDTAMTRGRGSGKTTPEAVVAEFWTDFARDHYEMRIGKTKLLFALHRLLPRMAERRMRGGL
jgi:short-subunit dehydrogenase involved in D-alanine esterification of teichoic acids